MTVAWDACTRGKARRLLKLPSYPWQTKRYWNETQEAAESLFYDPVHPLLGQSVSAVHPTWEAELSTVLNAVPRRSSGAGKRRRTGRRIHRNGPGSSQCDLRVEPQRRQPGAAARRHPRRHLRPHPADDPQRGTTARWSSPRSRPRPTGDSKWTITATAELNTLPPRRAPSTRRTAQSRSPRWVATTSTPAPQSIGFDYGDAFRSVQSVTAGEDWAVAEITVPPAIADELDQLPIPSRRSSTAPSKRCSAHHFSDKRRARTPTCRPGFATARSTVRPKTT